MSTFTSISTTALYCISHSIIANGRFINRLIQPLWKNYLVVVDRYSGFPWAFKLSSTSTDAVWSCLKRIFFEHGYPRKIMSDNGPQFRGKFKELCVEKSIQHRTSSPYNPSSNGLAESAVKRISHLLKKNDNNFEKFEESLLELRATASSNGDIPATKFFSRNIITSMPTSN